MKQSLTAKTTVSVLALCVMMITALAGSANAYDYEAEFSLMASWLTTQQQASGGIQEGEDYTTVVETDNTAEAIWIWSRYAELTGDYTTYIDNINDAWTYCNNYPSWQEHATPTNSYNTYNVGWGMLAEMKYRQVYEGRGEYVNHTSYGQSCANHLVTYTPGTSTTTDALCLGLAAGALYQYGVDVDSTTYRNRAVVLGGNVLTWLNGSTSRFGSESWAVSGGVAVWGVLNSYYKANSGGAAWAATADTYMPLNAIDGANNNYEYGHDGWYAWGHYALSEYLGGSSFTKYQNVIDLLLSSDGDSDGGIRQGSTYTNDQDYAWTTNCMQVGLNFGLTSTVNYTISGTITSGGSPLADVTMNGLPGNPLTDVNGFYSAEITSGWSGTVTPTKSDYIFSPTDRTYSSVDANQTSQDYTATYSPSTDVEILGSWVADLSHAKEAGSERALIFVAHEESTSGSPTLTSVTYGGQTMTKVIEISAVSTYGNYVAAFILNEAGVAAATNGTFVPAWSGTTSSVSYSSVFLSNVDQTTTIGDSDSASSIASTPNPITTSALSNENGDMVIVAATCGNNGSYTLNNGFTEGTDQSVGSNGHTGVTGNKSATGADETPSATYDATPNRQAIIGFVVQAATSTMVTVPDVVGMTQADANSAIISAGLVVGTITTQCSDTVTAGDVISQDPNAGSSVSSGSAVDMVVSSGQPSVPDVTGMDEVSAIAAINAVSYISYGSSSTACSDTVPAGDVISQSITGTAPCGTVVDLVVSTGQLSVPDVTGMDEASAIAAINAVSYISYGSSSTACSDTVSAGDVISQSVTGTTPCGTVVDLVVSSGQPSVPDVTGMDEASAIAAINAVSYISYGSSSTACSDTVPAGDCISQSITGTAPCGTVVDLVVSTGQPSVPDVTGMDEASAIAAINTVADISYGSSSTACSDTVPAGDVISQSITGIATCGTVVDLVVSSGQPSVPDVTGMDEASAIAAINAVDGISYGSSSTVCSDTVPAGDCLSQSVTGTTTCGTVVDLVVSSGQPSVPDVTGMDEAGAIAAINAVSNISYGSSSTACSDTVAAGDVISQSVTGTAPCGTVVNLVVSTGQPSVPNVTGMDEASAIAAIDAVDDISYGSSTTQCSDVVTTGYVISQSVIDTVPCGTVVNLVVSSGSPSVPDVTGMDEASAIAAINAVDGISYGSSSTVCSDTVTIGDVISQSVTGAATCGTVVDLVVSSGQPSVPDVTGMDEAGAIAAINAVSDISYGSSTTACSDTITAGDVISQSVTGTTSCGTIVDLVVSSGQPSVPNVTGMDEAAAIAGIDAVDDISYGSTTMQCSDVVTAGYVLSQSVIDTVPCGTVVDLVVSSGQPSVPNVTGMDEAAAIAGIDAVDDISYGSTTMQCSDVVTQGYVISQSVIDTVPCGTVVDLVVSSGQPSVPDVTGMDEASAIAAINAVSDISYGSSSTACSDTVGAGEVISQSATGTTACGTVVDLVVSSGQPSVPDVTGMGEAAAIAAINAVADISYGSSTYEYSPTVPTGDVISQSATGTASCGTVVDLVVSSGECSAEVPNVTAMTEAGAIAAINDVNNISYGSSTTQCSDVVTAGYVMSQSVIGTVACGTVVDLVVSSGQPDVPDVTGMTEAGAIAAINAIDGLNHGTSSTECSDTIPAGEVISQSVTGTVVCGTVVDLIVSSGQPDVPDVTGMDETSAMAVLDAIDNISYSIYPVCSDTVSAGDIVSQSVVGTVPCGTAIDLTVSYGQPSVPDLTGMTESEAIDTINSIEDISYGSTSTACSDTIFAGNVMGQSATGTVPCGTEINLVISYGQPVVPYLTGMTESAAIATINSIADISYGSSTYQPSETVPYGEVISQSISGTVLCGTVVDLVVSSGGPPTTVISNGTGGGDWHTSTTWTEGMIPRAVDDVVIQTGDTVTFATTAECALLTMEAGSNLTMTAGGPVPGSSWSLDPASTIQFDTVVPNSWVNPTFGNLVFNLSANYSLPESITVMGDLNILSSTIRGIGTTSGTNTHYIAGNVNISGNGRMSAVNQTSSTSASCIWNIGGNVDTGSNYNRIQLYESAGPHTGSAVFNIDGDLILGNSSYIMLKSSSSTTADYPEGIINLKGDFIHDGTISINSISSGTSPGLSINFVGTTEQTWSGDGRFSISAFTANMNINNPAGVILGSSWDISDNTAVVLTNGKLTTTSLKKLNITHGSLVGGSSSSYINGPLGIRMETGAQNATFPIGDATAYTPVNLDIASVYYSGLITVSTTPGMHSQITTSGLDINKSLNRYYTVENTGEVLFTTATVTFNFDPNDVIGGADPNQYIVKKFDIVTWSTPTTANPLATSIQATGITAFSEFAIGHPCQAVVPDVTGMSEADAIAAIDATAHISYGSSYPESSDTVPIGYVISQSSTGTVSCGTVIDLTISTGPDEFVARIMPLGDSITRGWWGSVYDDGYRKPLYEKLKAAHYNFDLLGSQSDGNFADPHHEGHDGWHADKAGEDDILGQVYNWLTDHPVDIILLHIGTNDITYGGQDVNEVNNILDEIDRFSTDITVVLALIINRETYSPVTSQYNVDLYNMAQNRIALGDNIIIVDMESALDYETEMADNLHPNDAGYAIMADVWFDALSSILPSMYDLNQDGFIDWLDVAIIHENWLSSDPNAPGDFDGNNLINFLDFYEFGLAW